MGLAAKLLGYVSRGLPQPTPDQLEQEVRLGRYDELMVIPAHRKMHNLADEGTYFTCNNAQTGLATLATQTAFAATTSGFILIANTDSPTNTNNRRIYLDYAALVATAAGTAGASVQMAIQIDTGNRYSSGGTELTSSITSPNMDVGKAQSVARVWSGGASALTLAAATQNARTPVGNRFLKGAIPVIGDEYYMNFGGSEPIQNIVTATITKSCEQLPAIIIGAQQCAIIHLWLPSQSAASSYIPELGWWER